MNQKVLVVASLIIGCTWLTATTLTALAPSQLFFSFLCFIPLICLGLYLLWFATLILYAIANRHDRRSWRPLAVSGIALLISIGFITLAQLLDLKFHANKNTYEGAVKLATSGSLEPAKNRLSESNYFLPKSLRYLSFDGGVSVMGGSVMFHVACDPITADFCTGIAYVPTTNVVVPFRCPGSVSWRKIHGEEHWYICE